MRRFGDWALYAAIAVLAAAVLLPFALPAQAQSPLVAAGRRRAPRDRVVPRAHRRLQERGHPSQHTLRPQHRRHRAPGARGGGVRGGDLGPAQRTGRSHGEPPQQPLAADDPAPEGPQDGRPRGRLLPDRSAGQAGGRGSLQAVRAVRRRQVHLEGGRPGPRSEPRAALRRGGVRHRRARDQDQVREGHRRRGREAHQRPRQGDPRRQARDLHRAGPRRARDHEHGAFRVQRGEGRARAFQLRGEAARPRARGQGAGRRGGGDPRGPAHGPVRAGNRRPRRLSRSRTASFS